MKSKHHYSTRFHTAGLQTNCFSILVVDDLPENRKMLSQVLRTVGYDPLVAADGAEALAMLESGLRPDLVITDVEMPGMTGAETVRQIRAMSSGVAAVPILAASGNPEISLRLDMLEAGADAFLGKPMVISELLETIRGLLQPGVDRGATRSEAIADLAK